MSILLPDSIVVDNYIQNPHGRTAVYDTALPNITAPHAISMTLGGVVEYEKDADVTEQIYSNNKVLTALVSRQYITDDRLDDTVTFLQEDEQEGSASNALLEGGDVVSYRDLYYGMLIRSGNDASRAIARNVGYIVDPQTSDPIATFVAEMDRFASSVLGWVDHDICNAWGLAYATSRELARLFLEVYRRDHWIMSVMRKDVYEMTVGGPNARQYTISHTMMGNQDIFPGFLGGKTGTSSSTGRKGLGILWEDPYGEVHATVIQQLPEPDDRYDNMQEITRYLNPHRTMVYSYPIEDSKFENQDLNQLRLSWSSDAWSIDGGVLTGQGSDGLFRFFPDNAANDPDNRAVKIRPYGNVRFSLQYRWRGTGGVGDTMRVRWRWGGLNGESGTWVYNGWQGITRDKSAQDTDWQNFSSSRDAPGNRGYCFPVLEIHEGAFSPGCSIEIRYVSMSGSAVEDPTTDPDLEFGESSTYPGYWGVVGLRAKGWDNNQGHALYYSPSRDSLAMHKRLAIGGGQPTRVDNPPETDGPVTYLTHILEHTHPDPINFRLGVSSGTPATGGAALIPPDGGILRWVREEGSGVATNARMIRFGNATAEERFNGHTVYFRSQINTQGEYLGPRMDGDTDPFVYEDQTVYPRWDGTPHDSTSRFRYYVDDGPWRPEITWHEGIQKAYHLGVSKGLVELDGQVFSWSGLRSVTPLPEKEEMTRRYLDGVVYDVRVPPVDFQGKLSAYTYPLELEEAFGTPLLDDTSMRVHGQRHKPFNLSYRTEVGTSDGVEHYKLHFIYGIYTRESVNSYSTINDRPEGATFDFDLMTVSQPVSGYRSTSYFTVDSREENPAVLANLEKYMYGYEGSTPAFPSIEDLRTYLQR